MTARQKVKTWDFVISARLPARASLSAYLTSRARDEILLAFACRFLHSCVRGFKISLLPPKKIWSGAKLPNLSSILLLTRRRKSFFCSSVLRANLFWLLPPFLCFLCICPVPVLDATRLPASNTPRAYQPQVTRTTAMTFLRSKTSRSIEASSLSGETLFSAMGNGGRTDRKSTRL